MCIQFLLFSVQNTYFGYMLEPPCQNGFNVFLSKITDYFIIFSTENFQCLQPKKHVYMYMSWACFHND